MIADAAPVIGIPAWKDRPNGKRDRFGMLCPHCAGDTGVTDSRPAPHNTIRRRRVCFACGHRLTTFEVVADDKLSDTATNRLLRQAAKLRTIADHIEQILSPERAE